MEFWWCVEASVPTVHVWVRWFLPNVKNNFTIDLHLPPPIRLPPKSMTNYCNFACILKKKSLEPNRNSTGRRPLSPPSGPTPLGPHFFWVVVCAVCAAPDSVACCCFACCLCSCCCLCVFLLSGRRPSPLPPLQCLTFQNVNNNFFTIDWSSQPIETKFAGIPPNFHGKTLLLPPLPPPFGAPHLLASIFLVWPPPPVFGPLCCCCCEKHTLAAFDLPKCLYCFCCFLCCFCHFCCCFMLVFLVVCCLLLFVLLLLPLLRFVVVHGVAFIAVASCCCSCLLLLLPLPLIEEPNPPLQLLTCCFCCFCCCAAVAAFAASWCYCAPVCATCFCVCGLFFFCCYCCFFFEKNMFVLLCLFYVLLLIICAALPVVCAAVCCCFCCWLCAAFTAAFGSPSVEKPTLATFDLAKCLHSFCCFFVLFLSFCAAA